MYKIPPFIHRLTAPLLTILLCLSAMSASGVTLLSDDFSGSGTLNGLSPDIAPSGVAWTAPTGNLLQAGGVVQAVTTTSNLAFLDFGADYFKNNPGIYTLSIDVALPSLAPNLLPSYLSWVGIGFIAATPSTTMLLTGYGMPWMMLRSNGEARAWGSATSLGANTAGQVFSLGTSHTLNVTLDTSAANWQTNWTVDGTAVGSYTYTTNQDTIRYIGLGTGANGSGSTASVGSITLNFIPVPEPSSLGFLGFVFAAAVFGRRRMALRL